MSGSTSICGYKALAYRGVVSGIWNFLVKTHLVYEQCAEDCHVSREDRYTCSFCKQAAQQCRCAAQQCRCTAKWHDKAHMSEMTAVLLQVVAASQSLVLFVMQCHCNSMSCVCRFCASQSARRVRSGEARAASAYDHIGIADAFAWASA